MDMLEDLSRYMSLEQAAEFLQRYEGKFVKRVRPQYVRAYVGQLLSCGVGVREISAELKITERQVFNIKKSLKTEIQNKSVSVT